MKKAPVTLTMKASLKPGTKGKWKFASFVKNPKDDSPGPEEFWVTGYRSRVTRQASDVARNFGHNALVAVYAEPVADESKAQPEVPVKTEPKAEPVRAGLKKATKKQGSKAQEPKGDAQKKLAL